MTPLRFLFQTFEFDGFDIHVRSLRDNQQFFDLDGVAEKLGISSASWPIFGVVWDSGQVLASVMLDYKIGDKRILEVGCGIALASLLLNHRHADITATDYHPEAEAFLLKNTQLNQDIQIPFVRTGWADIESSLGKFDVVIGSDVLYESEHVDLLCAFIEQHAKPQCEVILVDPRRGHHAKFSKQMVELGYLHTQYQPTHSDKLGKSFKGQILNYLRA